MDANNPLKQYFRQPSIYLRLPSQGNFYPPGSIDMPPNGEIPVYPMTAIDEITYRTPDALFNGSAVISVIQSCVPNIKDAWSIPAMDVDSILVAIRIATYGHDMDFESTCPFCNKNNNHTADLRQVLDRLRAPDYSKSINQGDLQVYFKPMTYKNLNENNQIQFEEQKVIQVMEDSDLPEVEKIKTISAALQKLTTITVKALAQSILEIKTPTAMVNDPVFIEEFLVNCDRTLFNKIRDHVIDVKAEAEMQPFEIQCPEQECKNKYMQTITLDMTSFFEDAS